MLNKKKKSHTCVQGVHVYKKQIKSKRVRLHDGMTKK